MVGLPNRSYQTGRRLFPTRVQRDPFDNIIKPNLNVQPVQVELPLPANQSIAASATVTARETIRAVIEQVILDVPRNMQATLSFDNDNVVRVTDRQGLSGIREVGRRFVTNAVATFTNQIARAQNVRFILKGG